MMKDNSTDLILLTKNFPYGIGEEFIESEIGILSCFFKNIYIIAIGNNNSKQTRQIPENVNCISISDVSEKKYLRLVYYLLTSIRYIPSHEFRAEIMRCNSFDSKLRMAYYYARTSKILKQIKRKQFLNPAQIERAVIYSYWFSDTAYLSIKLQSMLSNKKTAIVSRAHRYDLYDYAGNYPFREEVFKKVDKVYTCSKDGANHLIERYALYNNKIETSYLGTKDYNCMNVSDNTAIRIVTCSTITKVKRVKLVAEALVVLEGKGVNVEWLCFGDGPLLPELRDYVAHNICNSKVTFKGHISNQELIKFYKEGHVSLLINVSSSEGLPVSIMEAISFGIPALATDVGGTREIVKDGVTGFLLEKDVDASVLADMIVKVITTPFDRKAIRDYWCKNFNAADNYAVFARKINQLVNE